MRSDEDLALAVKRGVYFLDETVPAWREKIVLNQFDIMSECQCVIGMVCGDYADGCKALDITLEEAQDMGFDWKAPQHVTNAYNRLINDRDSTREQRKEVNEARVVVMQSEYTRLQKLWLQEFSRD